jgi:hypothetical protein
MDFSLGPKQKLFGELNLQLFCYQKFFVVMALSLDPEGGW